MDSGFLKLALVALVGLIVLGPERLPRVARQVGLWVGRTRRYLDKLTTELEREVQADETRVDLERFRQEVNQQVMDPADSSEHKRQDDDTGRDNGTKQ